MIAEAYRPQPFSAAPRLHRNLLLSSLQLLIWIMLRPSVWCAYVATVRPVLRPDFRLLDLRGAHWRDPLIQRIFACYLVFIPLIMLLNCGALWLLHRSGEALLIGIAAPLMVAIFYFLLASIWISVPVGIVLSVPGSLIFGLGYAVLGKIGYPGESQPLSGPIFGAVVGLAGGVAGSVAASLVAEQPDRSATGWGTLISGGGTGIVLGGAALFAMFSILRAMVALVFGVEPRGGPAQSLFIALPLLLALLLIFVIVVGWERARLVLVVNAAFMLAMLLLFGVLARFGLFEAAGIGFAAAFIALIGIPYSSVERIAGVRIAALATALGLGIGWIIWLMTANGWPFWPVFGWTIACIAAGLLVPWWEPLIAHPFLQLWNLLLLRLDEQHVSAPRVWLWWHAAFWCETHILPFRGLDEHLVMIALRHPHEGEAALDYLSTIPSQRRAVRAARVELVARSLERCADVAAIARTHNDLDMRGSMDGPIGGLLQGFNRIAQTLNAALNSTTGYHQQLMLRTAQDHLHVLGRDIAMSGAPAAARFRPIVARWHDIIAAALQELTAAVEESQEIANPYIFSVPLSEHVQLFVGRTDVAARIEQLILDRHRPPLLLYGQRRMGKTSLLRNLGRLLPSNTVLFFVDGEGIASASSYPDLLYALAAAMVRSAEQHPRFTLWLPERAELEASPFTTFNVWLDHVEVALRNYDNSIALLALDEFEALEGIANKGRFDETDVLRLIRNIIQHRPRFKVLLAGSHTLDEFRHWASYLINTQVIKITYLAEKDVLELIESPITNFELHYEPEASRHILWLTRGHPHLVQLLCYEIVELKNQQPPPQRRLVTVADVEAAVPHALATGDFFFADLANQVGPAGARVVRFIAAQPDGAATAALLAEQNVAGMDDVINLLLRRDLIEETAGAYRLQVELIRRWFAHVRR